MREIVRSSPVVLAALLVAGCTTVQADMGWSSLIKPVDPPPIECTKKYAYPRKPESRTHNGDEAAREYAKLRHQSKRLWGALRRCQRWAKGQRDAS